MKERQGDEDGGGREEDDEEEEEEKEKGRDEEDDGRVLGVFVHHSDYLPIGDQNILHPNVKVISTMLCLVASLVHFHSQVLLVNLADGGHVRKSNSSTNASYAQESDSNVTHILPLMTQPFNFRYGDSISCEEHRIGHLLSFTDCLEHPCRIGRSCSSSMKSSRISGKELAIPLAFSFLYK